MQFETGAVTHVGNIRKLNEDSMLVDERHGVWLVADGMGGHKDGHLASSIVVEAAKTIGNAASAPDLLSRFNDRILNANARLTGLGDANGHAIIGTTVAAVLVHGRQFACVWAGDSRIYLVRRNTIQQISVDHTEVQELLSSGVISEEEAQTWPRRNVITRAIGVGEDPGLDIVQGSLQPDDRFVICSDGLTGHVGSDEILKHAASGPAQAACEALVQLALARGGNDNVTVIILHVSQNDDTTVLQRH